MENGLDGVIKINMKKFDLQEYIKNPFRKVITKDGKPVRILCIDAKGSYPIIALASLNEYNRELILRCEANGSECDSEDDDLFFDVETKHGWVNLYRTEQGFVIFGSVYDTKEDALDELEKTNGMCKNIDTIQIEWEEES